MCQFCFSRLLIEIYLAHWLFLEQGGTWWQYGTHKWYAIRKSLRTTGLQRRSVLHSVSRLFFSFILVGINVWICCHLHYELASQDLWILTVLVNMFVSNVIRSQYRSQTIFSSQCDSLPEERKAFSKRKLSSCFHWLCLWRESHVIESTRTLRRRQCTVTKTVPLCRAVQQVDFESV